MGRVTFAIALALASALPEIPSDAPTVGPASARVTIVEFADFQCPYCAKVVPTLEQIRKTYGDDVRIVFRNLPLPFHEHAALAAKAGVAANEQGKFWPMYRKLFANQGRLERTDLLRYAREIGLNTRDFEETLDSQQARDRVQLDVDDAARAGVHATPTFLINGVLLSGAQPFERFRAIIDKELARP